MTQPTRGNEFDPSAPTLQPGEREEWPRPRVHDTRALLAFVIAAGAAMTGLLAFLVIRVVREHPLEFIIGALVAAAVSCLAWLVAGVILRREEARRQR